MDKGLGVESDVITSHAFRLEPDAVAEHTIDFVLQKLALGDHELDQEAGTHKHGGDMKRKRWLWFAVLFLMGVIFILQGVAQADSMNRAVSQGAGPLLYEWGPMHGDPRTRKEKGYAMESNSRITPSIGRIGSTTFYVIGFGFTPSERIVCKRSAPNGQESNLNPQATSPSGALVFAYDLTFGRQTPVSKRHSGLELR